MEYSISDIIYAIRDQYDLEHMVNYKDLLDSEMDLDKFEIWSFNPEED